jgi:hypothetical protein
MPWPPDQSHASLTEAASRPMARLLVPFVPVSRDIRQPADGGRELGLAFLTMAPVVIVLWLTTAMSLASP